VVRELADRSGIAKSTLAIETGAGTLACELRDGSVVVAINAPRLVRAEIPMTGPATSRSRPGDDRCIEQPLPLADRTLPITCVSMGNPHAIAFVDGDLRSLAATVGPKVETHAWFPHRTNAEFVRRRDARELDVVV